MYTFRHEQTFTESVDTLWKFVSSPANLEKITPGNMGFEIMGDPPGEMFNGQQIEYRVRIPFLGRRKWVSELKHIEVGKSFVDEQLKGPYQYWYHYHELKEQERGTLMIDIVNYVPPFGFLGKIAQMLYIRPSLQKIFTYRRDRLRETFGGDSGSMTWH